MSKSGWTHTAEAKAKISRSMKGKKCSPAHKAKISASNRKRQALIRKLLREHEASAA